LGRTLFRKFYNYPSETAGLRHSANQVCCLCLNRKYVLFIEQFPLSFLSSRDFFSEFCALEEYGILGDKN